MNNKRKMKKKKKKEGFSQSPFESECGYLSF
jgi:hypothetical protein